MAGNRAGYYRLCNCCSGEFGGPVGAKKYMDHCAAASYYGVRMSPETTFTLTARERELLGELLTFGEWVARYYKDWTPCGPDVTPCAYGWLSFAGQEKAPEYRVWREASGL